MQSEKTWTAEADVNRLAYCGRKPGTKANDQLLVIPEWLVDLCSPFGTILPGKIKPESGLLLALSSTDTVWFHTLMKQATIFCFLRGRVKLAGGSPPKGSCVFYFGESVEAFEEMFEGYGLTLKPWILEDK